MSSVSADEPEGLPWLVRLDREVKDQNLNGMTEFVIRSNNSQTALNEAVALELLAAAGLASQLSAYARFSVNESDPRLRLVIENPNDEWMAANFPGDGILFKAEATGNWSYRGDDPLSYDEVFDLEAGGTNDDVADFAPLTAFLDFINNSDDETFAAELPVRLDVEKFAVYLAMMNLIANFDDIDGPGNNAYLFYDLDASQFTVVPWDMNLAFQGGFGGGMFGGQGGPGNAGAGQQGDGQRRPEMPEGGTIRIEGGPEGERGGFGGMSNPLVTRFSAVTEWADLIESTEAQLRADLYDSGRAAEILARWGDLLQTQATDLVDAGTIASESAAIAEFFTTA
ncbi:MAG: CotH kinase family protein [Thermomicrobiales bacterium]|nr:CotH kinase family protein [Thermomicrobiales bacterium]